MICYICGKELLDTDVSNEDHVPQKGFFPTDNPPGIKKLLVHEKCNLDFSFDEQYVISVLRGTGTWDKTGKYVWEKKGRKSITKPNRRGLRESIVRGARPAKEIVIGIPEYAEDFPATQIPNERLISVMNKVVRGLYFDEFGKTVESDGYKLYPSEFCGKQEIRGWNIVGQEFFSIGTSGSEEFKYLRRFISNTLEYNLFFYNTHYFRLFYSKHISTPVIVEI